jgi:hypothetical protein
MDKPVKKPRARKQPTALQPPDELTSVNNNTPVCIESKLEEPAPAPDVPIKPKRVRKPKDNTTAPSEQSPPGASNGESAVSASGCQAIIGSGAKKGQACGCKVKPPSIDRCGRHSELNESKEPNEGNELTHPKPKSKSKSKKSKRQSASAKASKEAQLRASVARLSMEHQTFIEVNEFNNAIYPNTNIVIHQQKPHAIGVQNADGTIRPLTKEEMVFCREHFIPLEALPVALSNGAVVENKESEDRGKDEKDEKDVNESEPIEEEETDTESESEEEEEDIDD